MKSLSNLYKRQVNQNRDGFYTRIIDHNELLEQKLSALSYEHETKMRRQRLAEMQKQAKGRAAAPDGQKGQEALEGQEEGGSPQDGQEAFSEGLFSAGLGANLTVPPELEIDYVEQAKEKAEQIVSKATADAEEILKKAVKEAENLKEAARKQAEAQGYAQGMEHAQAEEMKMREELRQLRQEQERAYTERLNVMEPELMDAVIEVFDNVLHTDFAARREILLHLIRNTVSHIKNSKEFRIRVSAADYGRVSAKRDEVYQKIGGEVVLDVVMDESMQEGQCTIDTDEGIFECGIDEQLANLIRDLKALSCMD